MSIPLAEILGLVQAGIKISEQIQEAIAREKDEKRRRELAAAIKKALDTRELGPLCELILGHK